MSYVCYLILIINKMNNEFLNFGQAITLLKEGKKIARKGWNGKGMFAYYVPANSYPTTTGVAREIAINGKVAYRAYIALKTADGSVATWAPSGSDALAEDWMVVEKETFKDRLIVEHKELIDKLEKLTVALELKKVPEQEVDILQSQLGIMRDYSAILYERINRAQDE